MELSRYIKQWLSSGQLQAGSGINVTLTLLTGLPMADSSRTIVLFPSRLIPRHTATCTIGTGLFQRVKRPGHGADHLPTSSAEFENG
jgi:hypothetical protein